MSFKQFFTVSIFISFSNLVVFTIKPVQHKHIKVFHAAAFQFLIKEPLRVLVASALITGQLFGNLESFARITINHTLFNSQLTVAVQIGIAGIKIVSTACHKQIRHSA